MKCWKIFLIFLLLAGCHNNNLNNIYSSTVEIFDKEFKQNGSGVVIYSKKGYMIRVLTAYHVLDQDIIEADKKKNKAIFFINYKDSKIKKEVTVEKVNISKDLAILIGKYAEFEDGSIIEVTDKNILVGDDVWILGSGSDSFDLTKGIVSNFIIEDNQWKMKVSAQVYYGSSGGGIFNDDFKLIGIVMEFYKNIPNNTFSPDIESIKGFIFDYVGW